MSDFVKAGAEVAESGQTTQPAAPDETAKDASADPFNREASPFGRTGASRAGSAVRTVAYASLVLLAGGFAYFTTRGATEADAAAEHQHGGASTAATASPVHIAADAARRIGVTFATATAGPLVAEVRTVGQVTYDETRVKAIAPKIHGWVDRLFVDFTGREVREGEPLLSIYSPMLVSAQEELLLAVRLAVDVENGTPDVKRAADDLVASARRRLLYWDIPAGDIEALERSGTVTKTLTLRSPVQGVVVEKFVLAGQRIMEGESLFRVADLSTVWVEGEIFERDLAAVRLGARVTVELQAYPGEEQAGPVTYIYPTVDPATRTTRVRVELQNSGLRLRPGMYATIRLPGAQRANVVSVPRSAVLATGERVIAFVRMDDGMLEPREVELGMTSDDRVEIMRGLKAGEVVVSSATFLVDAESNLGAAMGAMINMPGMDMGAQGAGQKPPASPGSDDAMQDMPGMKMEKAVGDSARKPPGSTPHDDRQE
ncbi:MAG TPA: efflux RND transporter periplasmic adaptor subunit [Gemmatimonadaceae bacterium]